MLAHPREHGAQAVKQSVNCRPRRARNNPGLTDVSHSSRRRDDRRRAARGVARPLVPFAAVARGRAWSAGRTRASPSVRFRSRQRVCAARAVGPFGRARSDEELRQQHGFGGRNFADWIRPGYGVWAYGARGPEGPGHHHRHYDHIHDPSRASVWGLFVLSCLDPCIAVVPILFAAAPLGRSGLSSWWLPTRLPLCSAWWHWSCWRRPEPRACVGTFSNTTPTSAAGGLIAVLGLVLLVLGI